MIAILDKIKTSRCLHIVFRVMVCIVVWAIFYLITIAFLTPTPAIFSLKSGELKCDTMKECVEAAKANAIRKWENQHQILEYIERWSQFAGFSILPLRYEINLDNRAYNQIEATGSMGEKRRLPTRVACGESFVEVESNSSINIESNLELKDVYTKMQTLLNKFDGCFFDLSQMNQSIKNSLDAKKMVVGPSEYVKISNEREFVFPIRIDNLSHLFIAIQWLVLLPVLFLSPKPIFKFISKGKLFFSE